MESKHIQYSKKVDGADLKKSLLAKLFEDLDIAHLIPNKDRGDARTNPHKRYEKPPLHDGKSNIYKKKTTEKPASEVKSLITADIVDSGDSFKIIKNTKAMHKDERKELDQYNGKTLVTVKQYNKFKTNNKTRVLSEQILKSCPEGSQREETINIDEKLDRINKNSTMIEEKSKADDKAKNFKLLSGKDIKVNEKVSSNKAFIDARKLIRQKYTIKLKNSNRNVDSMGNMRNEDPETNKKTENVYPEEENECPQDILQLIATAKANKKVKEKEKRKPIIKTIRQNNDNRVYKAVTFTEKNAQPPTPLQIKMPHSKKSVQTNTIIKNKTPKLIVSKTSSEGRKEVYQKKKVCKEKRTRRTKNRSFSPVLPTNVGCPQTEVAKWAPSSIDQYTKPYYEAWVDTTLAAISKCTEQEKEIINKQNIIRTFKRALEIETRPFSPDLVYEKFNDEKFMGRITVRKNR